MNQKKLLKNSIDEVEKLLIIAYRDAYQDLYVMLVDTYAKIIDADGKPLNSHLYSYGKYYTLMNKINDRLKELGNYEIDLLNDRLAKLYEDNADIMADQFSMATSINEQRIREIISSDWVGDGKKLSDRVWQDKANVAMKVEKMLTNSVVTGQSLDTYATQLKERFNDVEFWQAKRLVRTEMQHMLIQSTIDEYKKAGVKKYKVLAVVDDRTCGYCIGINEQEFDIDTMRWGVNIPPFHPSCRCSITAVM